MEFNFGGFEIRTEVDAIKFMKNLVAMMRKISTESINSKNIMAYIGIITCLEKLNNYKSKDADHYRAVLIELIDNYQSKFED